MTLSLHSTRPLRVLHVGKYYPPFAGGIEYFVADLLPALTQVGVEVCGLMHHHETGQAVNTRVIDGIRICRVPTHGKILYAPVSPRFPSELARLVADFQPDAIHWHVPNLSIMAALFMPSIRKIPWLVHWHADVAAASHDWRLRVAYQCFYAPLERALLKHAAQIIVTSAPYFEQSPALQTWKHKTTVIPLGVSTERLPDPTPNQQAWAENVWQSFTKPIGQNGTPLRLLSIGRLTYYKGHGHLLEALQGNPNAVLVIIGEGDFAQILHQKVLDLGLENQVKLMGFVAEPEKQAMLATSDVFCLPSLERTEAFGLVLLEAMRYGRPIMASHLTGTAIPWVVQSEETGYLLPAGEVSAWHDCIRQLCTDRRPLMAMIPKARARFSRYFAIQAAANQIHQVYQTVCRLP